MDAYLLGFMRVEEPCALPFWLISQRTAERIRQIWAPPDTETIIPADVQQDMHPPMQGKTSSITHTTEHEQPLVDLIDSASSYVVVMHKPGSGYVAAWEFTAEHMLNAFRAMPPLTGELLIGDLDGVEGIIRQLAGRMVYYEPE